MTEKQIKIIKHKKPIKLGDCGDILFPFKTWKTTSIGGGWYSKVPREFYKTKPFYPLTAINQNPWRTLRKLKVAYSDFKKMVQYKCPYTNYIHYWSVPVIIFTNNVPFWVKKHKPMYEQLYLDQEWIKDFYSIKDGLPLSKVQESLLGAGYTEGTRTCDGSGEIKDAIVALDNGDFLGVKVWMWYNN